LNFTIVSDLSALSWDTYDKDLPFEVVILITTGYYQKKEWTAGWYCFWLLLPMPPFADCLKVILQP